MPDRIVHTGRYLRFVVRDGWEFTQRIGISGIVGIVAVTDDGRLLLVEQYRPPLGARVLELPAGLVGDEPGGESEGLIEGARRELLEETGYAAREWSVLASGPASPGSSGEIMTLVLATGLARLGSGGGTVGESLVVHEVPLGTAEAWLAAREGDGTLVDLKVHAGLLFARRSWRA